MKGREVSAVGHRCGGRKVGGRGGEEKREEGERIKERKGKEKRREETSETRAAFIVGGVWFAGLRGSCGPRALASVSAPKSNNLIERSMLNALRGGAEIECPSRKHF